ncbi:hypothetical protein DVG80_34455 [Rhodococcus erythropolis]|nr:hypothetical protein DVG80_34455 [Rhodococcus erythropolis]
MTRNLQYNELIEVVSAWWDSRVVQDTQGSLTTAEALGDLAKWCNNLGYETPLELHSKQIISQNHAGKTTDLRSRTQRGWRGFSIPNLEDTNWKAAWAAVPTEEVPKRPRGVLGLAVRVRRLWLQGRLGFIPCSEIRPTRQLLALTNACAADLLLAAELINKNLDLVLSADVRDREVTAYRAKVELREAQRELNRRVQARQRRDMFPPTHTEIESEAASFAV